MNTKIGAASWLLTAIIALSGFAGLGYEIVWIRELSLALGTETMATLGAVAGYFAGLALGAFALDGRIRRARSPYAAYAALESVIGLWGIASLWLLPNAGRALPPLLGVEPPPALLWFASFALPILILLPATAAMGGTLTALERMTREALDKPRAAAAVYGANTAGAVAGALGSAYVLIPSFGLSKTLLFLALLNMLCVAATLALGRRTGVAPAVEAGTAPVPGAARLGTTLFATGLLGVAFEVLVVRLAAQTLQDTVYTFASLLAAYLLGTAAGSLLWRRVDGRAESRQGRLGFLLAATAACCLATAMLAPTILGFGDGPRETGGWSELRAAVSLFLVPSAAMGALFGHLAQHARDLRGSLGWAVGMNSLGAAAAPALASLVLIPEIGAWKALVLVAVGYTLLAPPRPAAALFSALPFVAGVILLALPAPSFVRAPAGGAVLATREGPTATASVVDDKNGVRYLDVNGHFRMGGTSSMRSDHRQAALPLLLHPAPRSALFLGVGAGATLAGAARFPDVAVRGVELSPEVVELLPWFAEPDPPAPPRVTVADARRYVSADKAQYDVIVADLFHPALDGSGALYTVEHFAAVRERLAPEGLFCQWLPLYQLDARSLRAIIRSFLTVFPAGSAWLNHYSVRTPMLALVGRSGDAPFDGEALAARLDDPSVRAVVKPLGFATPIDVFGQYVGGPRALGAFAGGGPRNTDDFPFVTFDARRNVGALSAPPWALLLQAVREIGPEPEELLASPQREALGPRLSAYWRARNRFLEAGAALPGDPRGRALVDAASPGLLAALQLSEEFEPAYTPLMSMAQALLPADRDAAARLLRAIAAAAPSRAEAKDLLASEFGP